MPRFNKWIVPIIVLLLLVSINDVHSAASESATSSFDLAISKNSVLENVSFDICEYASKVPVIGSGMPSTCPATITITEDFHQQIPSTFATASVILREDGQASVDVSLSPDLPSASLGFMLTTGNGNEQLISENATFAASGVSSNLNVQIPVGQVLDYLGQVNSVFTKLGEIITSLSFRMTSSDQLQTDFQGAGFSGTQSLAWSNAGQQTVNLQFAGGDETAILGTTIVAVQSWQISLDVGIKGLNTQIGSFPISVSFSSPNQNLFDWYEISGNSQYSDVSNSGWYLSGSSATLSIGSTTVDVTPGQREIFSFWSGSGTGSYSGSDISIPLLAENPINETADWQTQYSISLGGSGGTVSVNSTGPWYNAGTQLQFMATPDSSHVFKDWMVDGSLLSSSQTLSYSVNNPSTVVAQFVPTLPPTATSPSVDQSQTSISAWSITTFVAAVTLCVLGGALYLKRKDAQTFLDRFRS